MPAGLAAIDRATFADLPGLVIGTGSGIFADPLARVSLQSTSRIGIDGRIVAAGGTVTADLSADLNVLEFLPSQGIWLGPNSVIDVSGFARVLTNDLGTRSGSVFDAGRVSVRANRGSVVMLPGSVVNASGVTGVLDTRAVQNGIPRYVPTSIGSNGGLIELQAAESILASGTFRAQAGLQASGGQLRVVLDPSARNGTGPLGPIFPTGSRVVTVTNSLAPIALPIFADLPDSLSGVARISAQQIAAGGFDSATLVSRNLFGGSADTPLSIGAVAFDGDVSLSLGQRLIIDTPTITSNGGSVSLSAPYLALGSLDIASQVADPVVGVGSGRLQARAEMIELVGNSTLNGFENVRLESQGDIRGRGIQVGDAPVIAGSLSVSGDLTLRAQQVYPTTFSQFALSANSREGSTLAIEAVSGARAPVLSAGGSLQLAAPTIRQGGVLLAPFGEIMLGRVAAPRQGELSTQSIRVELLPGSETSTSGAGLTVPFGTIQGGFDWVYELPSRRFAVFDGVAGFLPSQSINLLASDVALSAGAVLDVSGGGDLVAYEFIPGVGGTRDVLGNALRPNQFAVLPGANLAFAPYDSREYLGSALQPGDSIYLAGAEGLPAGVYALLPARYALLPGAYLVNAAPGFADIAAGESFTQLDGSTVIAGYRTFLDGSVGASRVVAFSVRPGDSVQREANYQVSRANAFFSRPGIAESAAGATRRPVDAGRLAVTASASLQLDATLRASAVSGGQGASVDLSAENLRVVEGGGSSVAGSVTVDAGSIRRLGAQSVLLGGSRATTAGGTQLTTTASSLVVASGARIEAPEVILAATDTLRLEGGAAIRSVGVVSDSDANTVRVVGDGALLRASAGSQATIVRTGSSGLTGSIAIEEGALLATRGSLLLDATGNFSTAGQLDVRGAAVGYGANRVNLGSAPEGTPGLTLLPSQFADLGLRELGITSRDSIRLFGDIDLRVASLTLNSPGIVGEGSGNAALRADSIMLGNATGMPSAIGPAPTNYGTLTFDSRDMRLVGGEVRFDGVAAVDFRAAQQFIATAGTALSSSARVTVATPRVTAASGVALSLASEGALSLVSLPSTAAPAASSDLGARIDLTARSVSVDTRVDAAAGVINLLAIGSSSTDGISLGSSANLNASAAAETFDGRTAFVPAGAIHMTSQSGNLTAATGAILDVSAAQGGDAGAIALIAPRGQVDFGGVLRGAAQPEFQSGDFALDARAFGDLDQWSRLLNEGGLFGSRIVRLRGAGDLVASTGSANRIVGQNIELTADAGAIRIEGSIDASATDRARVSLAARDDVSIAGSILARTNATAGGRVELSSRDGGVMVSPTAIVDVGGRGATPTGRVLIRTHRDALATLTDSSRANDSVRIDGRIVGADAIVLEGVRAYEAVGGVISASDVTAAATNPWFADAVAFADTFDAIRVGLGLSADRRLRLVAGLEVFAPNDLRLAADWNLFNWSVAGQPGTLTLRAAGNLLLDRSISDGFTTPTTFALAAPSDARESWSYRLVGGADLGSARATGLLAFADLSPDSGDVRLAAGRISTNPMSASDVRSIRTGTGDIEIVAARDFELGNSASVVYTAGVASVGVNIVGPGGLGIGNRYPERGGDVSISAGRDVRGAVSNQLVTDWLWRTGRAATSTDLGSATGWTVNFQRFLQNVGALAGGNVEVSAGRDVTNLSVNIPSIGRQVGGTSAQSNNVQIVGGGRMRVDAGRNLTGGSYFVGLGSGSIRALGSVGSANPDAPTAEPVIALGDARFSVASRNGLQLASIVNPTLLRQGSSQPTTPQTRSVFSTYGGSSAVSLMTAASDLVLVNDPAALAARFTSMTFPENEPVAFRIYPPSLFATAARGNIEMLGSMSLYPAVGANVELFAGDSIRARETGPIEFLMSDTDPAALPSAARPLGDAGYGLLAEAFGTAFSLRRDLLNATVPVHSDARRTGTQSADLPVRFVARTGDIVLDTDNDASGFFLPKPVRFVAGRDIRDITLTSQHLRSSDVTSLLAGRDIIYASARSDRGTLLGSLREIAVDGPGSVEVTAGRNVDLRTSSGISTRGDVQNPNLAPLGASVAVLTGVGTNPPRTDAFLRQYVETIGRNDAVLFAFLREIAGTTPPSKAAAIASLTALSPALRLRLAEQVLFAELRAVGREAARTGSNDFRAAYAALEALFPGSNPEPGSRNAFAGDLNLFFSRIYTLDGGNILLLTPGGQINAGLATPPAAFGIRKEPSQLGVVAQGTGSINALSFGDFQVNESRVFAADGGDILIWATRGDIDAGRGAKTAISAPPPSVTIDENGRTVLRFPAALQGSGIQTLATSPGVRPGNVDLFAPRGVVNAGDAGIVAGNLTIAATAVLGANNIQVSGASVGVPVATTGLAAGLSGASSAASGSAQAASAAADSSTRTQPTKSPLADQALGFLDVFLEGFGDEVCKANDIECLKRNQRR